MIVCTNSICNENRCPVHIGAKASIRIDLEYKNLEFDVMISVVMFCENLS
jgi:hypothetical protein